MTDPFLAATAAAVFAVAVAVFAFAVAVRRI
jgi:hypothetical protein